MIDSVLIGFGSGKRKNVLLPPLSASASPGELISIIGRNGIGKSTLLRSLTGIQDIHGGKVFFNDREISNYTGNELAHTTGFISTEQVRISNMTVFDLVSLGRYPHTNWLGTLDGDDLQIISDAMEKTSVIRFSDKYVAGLSDGERQRSMIARLLAQDTPIMLMDEPTAFLDIRSKFEIMHLLHELSHLHGKTIIITTHDLDLALRYSDKIWLILDDGIREGAPEDLLADRLFERLFDSDIIKFNSGEGTYIFKAVPKGSIHVEGDMFLRQCTEKAVIRAGFSVTDVRAGDYIQITGNRKWILNLKGNRKEYSSIYDLMRDLNSLT